jgi:uncharacterized radical SAM superfamily protein
VPTVHGRGRPASSLPVGTGDGQLDITYEEAWRVRQANFDHVIGFDYPLDTLVVSLTGRRCELDCAHCGRHYLESMIPVWEAQPQGATSCLVSGGCDATGRVPVMEHLETVRELRQGRIMNWHVGLIGQAEAEAIAPFVDVISFDFVGDDETIREVYGIEAIVDDYVSTYQLLRSYATVIPHITVGLRGGRLSGEYHALEILAGLGLDGLTFIVLIPTPGTRFADCDPPAPEDVAALLAEARIRLPSVPIHLGCMRPHGSYRDRLDPLAVRAGVNVIVSPAKTAVALADDLGLKADKTRECCAVRFKRKGYYG